MRFFFFSFPRDSSREKIRVAESSLIPPYQRLEECRCFSVWTESDVFLSFLHCRRVSLHSYDSPSVS